MTESCKPLQTRSRPSSSKPFWSNALNVLKKTKQAAHKRWKDAGKPNDASNVLLVNYQDARKAFRKEFRKNKAEYGSVKDEEINNCSELDEKRFWYLLKGNRNKLLPDALRKSDGVITNDPVEIRKIWFDHYKSLGQKKIGVDSDCDQIDDVRYTLSNLVDQDIDAECLKSPITFNEVSQVCKKSLKKGKSRDHYKLQNEHFIYGGDKLYHILTNVFNDIIELEYYPKMFLESFIIPVYKGGNKDRLDVTSYRAITIQCILCKIFETIIYNRSEEYIKAKCNISYLQGACKKGLSSVTTSLLLREAICHNVERGNTVYNTFFDAKCAFDTVWIEGLIFKLYKKGVNGKLVRLIYKSFKNCKSYVMLEEPTEWFECKVGIRQGGILSMLLYISFNNDLLIACKNAQLGCKVSDIDCVAPSFADDVSTTALHSNCMQSIIN